MRVLVVRAEPMDNALLFFGGALGVQGHEEREDFRIGQGDGPAVSGGDGGIQIIVELFKEGDKAPVVDVAFFGDHFQGAAIGNRRRNIIRVSGTSRSFILPASAVGDGQRWPIAAPWVMGAELLQDVVEAGEGEAGSATLCSRRIDWHVFAVVLV